MMLNPSPIGRGWRAATGEGRSEQEVSFWYCVALVSLTPTLSRRERELSDND